jgi:hypothetical protein
MDSTPQLRPLSIGDLFDAAFRLYRAHFLTFVGIVAAVQIPMLILQILTELAFGAQAVAQFTGLLLNPTRLTTPQFGDLIAYYTGLLGISVLQVLVAQSLSTAALARAVAARYHGQPLGVGAAYRLRGVEVARLFGAAFLRLLMSAVLTAPALVGYILLITASMNRDIARALIVLLFCMVGVLIFVPLAIFVLIRFMFATQAIILEGRGVIGGLRRSWQLFGASFWRTLGTVLLMLLLWGVLYLGPVIIGFVILHALFPDPLGQYEIRQPIQTIIDYITQILVLPFLYIGYTLVYFDLRTRTEGYDIEVLAQQAATT